MSVTNFLIGRGELLTADLRGPKGFGGKAEVYTIEESRDRLHPQLVAAVRSIDSLPAEACPSDLTVVRMAMNPSYVAKSYYPEQLLRESRLESVGSRSVRLTPGKWSRSTAPSDTTTTELFVAGSRGAFRALEEWVGGLSPSTELSNAVIDATHVERVAPFLASDRLHVPDESTDRFFEVGLQLPLGDAGEVVREQFRSFAERCEVGLHDELSFEAGSLWFAPAEATPQAMRRLAEYSFVRVIRPMPRLRGLRPVMRSVAATVNCKYPQGQPMASEPRVAVLDAGLPDQHALGPWIRAYRRMDEDAEDDPDGPGHGLAVTSAFLFGPIRPGGVAPRPFAFVDHLRVLDRNTGQEDPLELYRTLGFVEEVLLSREYEFVNLSLGPALPVEDTDVHAWTSVIDDILSDGNTFLTVAAGNNGEADRASGNARIQVPADCVNAIAVGAASSTGPSWSRASYSALGPGRRPGLVKPDVLVFGGDGTEYFHVAAPGATAQLAPQLGTSFAAPYLLRSAVGIRAYFGSSVSTMAIRALLVHAADRSTHHVHEVGWGKVPDDLDAIITSPEGIARVVYQGVLKPGKYLRASIPMPTSGLAGMVTLRATFCFASEIDPQDAVAYTRSGLEVTFRPHSGKTLPGKSRAKPRSFFDDTAYVTEEELRTERGKWETVLHAEERLRGSSLKDPVFDIHYVARDGGRVARSAGRIPYALVISIEAKKHPNLYDDILAAYPSILVPIQPQISLPVRT